MEIQYRISLSASKWLRRRPSSSFSSSAGGCSDRKIPLFSLCWSIFHGQSVRVWDIFHMSSWVLVVTRLWSGITFPILYLDMTRHAVPRGALETPRKKQLRRSTPLPFTLPKNTRKEIFGVRPCEPRWRTSENRSSSQRGIARHLFRHFGRQVL